MSREIHISKSKYLNGLQCPKLLWTQLNKRELIPPPGPAQQHIFDTGHAVGDLAKQLYPHGVEVPMNFGDLAATARETEALLARPWADQTAIFEASFMVDRRYCRVDVLVPVPDDPDHRWDLVEVKSATRVKDINVNDVAFQADALARAGVPLRRLGLMRVNTAYVCGETFDPRQFFVLEDVTERATAVLQYVPPAVDRMCEIVAGSDPDTPLGKRCNTPYPCPLQENCWAVLPPDNVTHLHRCGARAFALMDDGIFKIADVPADRLTSAQKIQQQTVVSGRPHIAPEPLRKWLDELVYPVHHLDFETMNPALPPFAGVRPYQRLPFQFSLHIQDRPGAAPRHVEFLADQPSDPRPALVAALHTIGDTGSILAWNMGFEKGVLNDLAELYPAQAEWLAGLNDRMIDLIVPFRNFWYHHPAQRGRCSLKAVLPAVTDLSYEALAIADGNHAARAYFQAVYEEHADREQTLTQLRAYCRLDTLAMVEILAALAASS